MENLFTRYGIPDELVEQRIHYTFDMMFRNPQERIYFEAGSDMGFLMDTGNYDARTEGMSYGMMMAVQMNEKEIFDRIWRYAWRKMHMDSGRHPGYFAWSTQPDGTPNSDGPAPDGEEYFAMALFFASVRWGDGEAPLDYSEKARDILRHCVRQAELGKGGMPMWHPENHLIKFIPEWEFSDPSYHLPHFYETFAKLADEQDRPFWQQAARASREYLLTSCHPTTGMAPEYANYNGTPETEHGHPHFFSDAYRVAMNIGLDSAWCGQRPEYRTIIDHLQEFLKDKSPLYGIYAIDGTRVGTENALHPVALLATTAAGSLATDTKLSRKYVLDFWNTPLRTGVRRYYDNCLYFFCLLMLGGRYQNFA